MAAMPRSESNEFPVFSGGRWFRKRTQQDQKMPIVEVADALDGAWRIIVDLNQVSSGELLTIDNLVPSPDGRKLALCWGVAGSECAVLLAIDVDSGRGVLDPEIGRASCRERVSITVSISLVAGSLNKKK